MISFEELCDRILMPKHAKEIVMHLNDTINYSDLEESLQMLFSSETNEDGYIDLSRGLGEDRDGMKMLTCMLHCARRSYAMYRQRNIPDEIFDATFKCFPRFMNEHYERFHEVGFNTGWWTIHQVSLHLFRLGELEFRMTTLNNEKVITFHIPSDAVFTPENVQDSIKKARRFFSVFFPEYKGVPYVAKSWLLDPILKQFLPTSSNILAFQRLFEIRETDYDTDNFMRWVFKTTCLPVQDLPENTSLQRNIKQHLLSGKKIGDALGFLIE